MFIFLSKLLPLFVYPLGLACLFILTGLIFWKKTGFSKTMLVLAFLVLFVCGNRYVASSFAKTLEWDYSAPTPLPQADVIVVLGGGTEPMLPPRSTVEVNAAGDRVILAARIFQQQPDAVLLLSGGDIDFMDQSSSTPAADMAELLGLMGVPAESMIIQDQSQNTYEDALYSCEIIKQQGFENVLLITSATHIPRSVKVFENQGCSVIPVPADYTITQSSWDQLLHPSTEEFFLNLVPSYSNLSLFTKTMKEYLGMFTYRLKGWL